MKRIAILLWGLIFCGMVGGLSIAGAEELPDAVGTGDGRIHVIPSLSAPSVKNGERLMIQAVITAVDGVASVTARIEKEGGKQKCDQHKRDSVLSPVFLPDVSLANLLNPPVAVLTLHSAPVKLGGTNASGTLGLWQAEWTATGLEEAYYRIHIRVTDNIGHAYTDSSLRFSDPIAGNNMPGTAIYPDGGMRRVDALTDFEFPENELQSAVIDADSGYAWFGTSNGIVVKVALGTGNAPPTRVGAVRLEEGEEGLRCAVIDTANGYAYFGTFKWDGPALAPGRVVKVALGAGDEPPTRVGALTLEAGEDGLRCAVIDAANGYAWFGTDTSPGRIIKVALGVGDEPPTRVGALTLEEDENSLRCAAIDAVNGHAFFGTYTEPGRVVKVALGEGDALPTRVGAVTLNEGEDWLASAVIDIASGHAFFGTSVLYSASPGHVVKVALGAGNDPPQRVDAVTLDEGEQILVSAVIDAENGYAWFGTSSIPGRVVKVALGAGNQSPTRVGAVTLTFGEPHLNSAVIDRGNGYAYFGTHIAPGRVAKVALGVGDEPPVRVDAARLNDGDTEFSSAVIDRENGYAYFATGAVPYAGRVVKVALDSGNAPPTRVGAVTLADNENTFNSAVIDVASGHAYFGTGSDYGSARVIKVALGQGDALPVRVGAVTLGSGENWLYSAVIDTASGHAYFGTGVWGVPGRVVKVALGEGDNTPVRVGALILEEGENRLRSAVIDTATGHAWFGTDTSPGRVIKVALGAGDALPTRIGAVMLEENENSLVSAVIDTASRHAWFGTDTFPGRVVKVALGAGDDLPARIGAVTLEEDENRLVSAVIDTVSGHAFFGTYTSPGRVVKVALGTGDDPPTRIGGMALRTGENRLASAVIDASVGHAWFGTCTSFSSVAPVALSQGQLGFIKGSRFSLPELGRIQSLHFYSHASMGQLRLGLYGAGASPALLWESPITANTASNDWLTVPIADGAPSSLNLPAGDYWLAWQVDTTADVPSHAEGDLGEGLLVPYKWDAFPTTLEAGTTTEPTLTAERWSGYITYDLLTPAAPSNPDVTEVGTDAITWTWQDNSDNETGFKVYAGAGDVAPDEVTHTTAADVESWEQHALLPNTQYAMQVAATNDDGDSAKTDTITAWTLAMTPLPPVVENPTEHTLDVSIGVGDGNPAYTEYALYCMTTEQWAQPDGSLGSLAAWQTTTDWGTTTVTGLADCTMYDFVSAARNGASLETELGPPASATTLDGAPPTITLMGDDPVVVECGGTYMDDGAEAWDACEGDMTADIAVANPVDASTTGTYIVRYNVSDAAGNTAEEVTRTVIVEDTTPPVITLIGDAAVVLECGENYTDAGAMAWDDCDGDLTLDITITNPVDVWTPDTYEVVFEVYDAVENLGQATRTVTVLPCEEGEFEGEGEGLVIESLSWEARHEGIGTLVDITFTFSHSENADCWLALWGHDEVNREHFPMQHFIEGDISDQTFSPGTHILTWIAGDNAGGRSSDDFQVFLRMSDEGRVAAGHYLVIDVSVGPDAESYPVEYRHDIDVTRDLYKTDRIVLRELPDGSYTGIYQITQQQYEHVTGLTPSGFSGNPMRPVERVSWNDITNSGNYETGFIAILRDKTGIADFDLPASMLWEYSCRAGAKMHYNDYTLNAGWGSDTDAVLENLGWYAANSSSRTHDVGDKQPNAWGCYDTHGNVWEWCEDWHPDYVGSARVLRGGGWLNSADICRAGFMFGDVPSNAPDGIGFRLALPAVTRKAVGASGGSAHLRELGECSAKGMPIGNAISGAKSVSPKFVQNYTTAALLGIIFGSEDEGEGETVEGEGQAVEGEGEPFEGEPVEGEDDPDPEGEGEMSDPLIIITDLENVSLRNGATFIWSIAVVGGAGPLVYQWQVSQDDGEIFVPVIDGPEGDGIYSGATTNALSLTPFSADMVGLYRVVVSDGETTLFAGPALLSLDDTIPAPHIQVAPTWFVDFAPSGAGFPPHSGTMTLFGLLNIASNSVYTQIGYRNANGVWLGPESPDNTFSLAPNAAAYWRPVAADPIALGGVENALGAAIPNRPVAEDPARTGMLAFTWSGDSDGLAGSGLMAGPGAALKSAPLALAYSSLKTQTAPTQHAGMTTKTRTKSHEPVMPDLSGCPPRLDEYGDPISWAFAPLPQFDIMTMGSPVNFAPMEGRMDFCAYADIVFCELGPLAPLLPEILDFAVLVQCAYMDINGPLDLEEYMPITGNGIPDGQYELGLVAALYNANDPEVVAAFQNNFTVIKDIIVEALAATEFKSDDKDIRSLIQGVAPYLTSALSALLAGFAVMGDEQTNAALDAMMNLLLDIGLEPPEGGIGAVTTGLPRLGPDGDADGDGFTNRQEYDYFVGELQYTPAQYVAAALDSLKTPLEVVRIVGPPSGYVLAGEAVTLTAETLEGVPVSYQWFKGNEPLANETDSSLLLLNLQESDSGVYRVDVHVEGEASGVYTAFYTLVVFELQISHADIPWFVDTSPPGSGWPPTTGSTTLVYLQSASPDNIEVEIEYWDADGEFLGPEYPDNIFTLPAHATVAFRPAAYDPHPGLPDGMPGGQENATAVLIPDMPGGLKAGSCRISWVGDAREIAVMVDIATSNPMDASNYTVQHAALATAPYVIDDAPTGVMPPETGTVSRLIVKNPNDSPVDLAVVYRDNAGAPLDATGDSLTLAANAVAIWRPAVADPLLNDAPHVTAESFEGSVTLATDSELLVIALLEVITSQGRMMSALTPGAGAQALAAPIFVDTAPATSAPHPGTNVAAWINLQNTSAEPLSCHIAYVDVEGALTPPAQPYFTLRPHGSIRFRPTERYLGVPIPDAPHEMGGLVIVAERPTLTGMVHHAAAQGQALDGMTPHETVMAFPEPPPLAIVEEPEGGVYLVGQGFTASVLVVGGQLPYAYQWHRDGAPVGVNAPRLVMESLTLADAGVYYCEVNDGDSMATSATFELEVLRDTDIRYVDAGNSGLADGLSWNTAFPTLQDGVDAAGASGEVWVAAGTYRAATEVVLAMRSGVDVYGGFVGGETERGQRDWSVNVAVIDGENARRCVTGADDATLDGFTITRGLADRGAGIYNASASPSVRHCKFINNVAVEYGGGMYNAASSPMVINCLFVGNTAAEAGGALYNADDSMPLFSNCSIVNNNAMIGGGMYNTGAGPVASNCIIWGNNAPDAAEIGGAILSVTFSCVAAPGYEGNGNINVAPMFIDAENGDFRLRAGSPCIDVGTAIGAPNTDIRGVVRPQGDGIDMGAYEYFPDFDDCYPDVEPPVITLLGPAELYIECGVPYTDEGAEAWDVCDGDLTNAIIMDNPVDVFVSGIYTVLFEVHDAAGNSAQTSRTVIVLPCVEEEGEYVAEGEGEDMTEGEGEGEDATEGEPEGESPAWVSVPNVLGLPQSEARSRLEEAGLSVGAVIHAASAHVPADHVMRQLPAAGSEVPPESPVSLTVSSGPGPEGFTAAGGANSIMLRWQSATSGRLEGYRLERRRDDAGNFTPLTSLRAGTTRYEDHDVASGTLYHYRLSAVVAGEAGPFAGPVSARAGTITLRFDDIDLWPGDCGMFGLSIDNASGLKTTGFELVFDYDPAVIDGSQVVVYLTAITHRLPVRVEVDEGTGRVTITAESPTPFRLVGEGRLFQVSVCAREDAPENLCGALRFISASFADGDGVSLPVDYADVGFVCVSKVCGRPGDVNNDRAINEADVDLLLEIAVRLITPDACHWKTGELNGDGRIDSADVALLLRMLAALAVVPREDDQTLHDVIGTADRATVVGLPLEIAAAPGALVEVPLTLEYGNGLAALNLALSYPSGANGLELEGYGPGAQAGDFLIGGAQGIGFLRLILASVTPLAAANTEVEMALLHFRVPENAQTGDQFPITIIEGKLSGPFGEDFEWYTDVSLRNGVILVDAPPDEGDAPSEGEGESQDEDDGCGCFSRCRKDADLSTNIRYFLGDWVLIGLSLLMLITWGGKRHS